jgi:hypothetical protein
MAPGTHKVEPPPPPPSMSPTCHCCAATWTCADVQPPGHVQSPAVATEIGTTLPARPPCAWPRCRCCAWTSSQAEARQGVQHAATGQAAGPYQRRVPHGTRCSSRSRPSPQVLPGFRAGAVRTWCNAVKSPAAAVPPAAGLFPTHVMKLQRNSCTGAWPAQPPCRRSQAGLLLCMCACCHSSWQCSVLHECVLASSSEWSANRLIPTTRSIDNLARADAK